MEKKTILVVEDEKAIADILVFNLQREGYDTIVAYDGTEGLRHALEDAPDLILLDVMLPGMDGFEVCKRVREKFHNTPIIMLTAREEETGGRLYHQAVLHARADGARENQYAPHGVGRGTGKSALAVRRRAAYFQGQRHGVQKRASAGAVGA